MEWKSLDTVINDTETVIAAPDVQTISQNLLSELQDGTDPLHAAKIAYTLALLALKSEDRKAEEAIKYIEYLNTLISHIVEVLELNNKRNHLVYVRSLADHWFEHLLMMASFMEEMDVITLLQSLRNKNHEKLLSLKNFDDKASGHEKRRLKKAIRRHAIFAGFFLAFSLFIGINSFYQIVNFAIAKINDSATPASPELFGSIPQQFLLFVFSFAVIIGVWRYLREPEGGE